MTKFFIDSNKISGDVVQKIIAIQERENLARFKKALMEEAQKLQSVLMLNEETDLTEIRKKSAIDQFISFTNNFQRFIHESKTLQDVSKAELEQIDELSKKTLGSYAKKAAHQVAQDAYMTGIGNKVELKTLKRKVNMEKAVDKLTKEEIEQIDEISDATLSSYKNKAERSNYNTFKKMTKDHYDGDAAGADKKYEKFRKRDKGIKTATKKIDKLAKEELEQIDESRPLSTIAREIRKDWGSKVNYAAKPYLDAMGSLDSIKDDYYQDSGKSVVMYFLSNATTWRGEKAKEIKAELKMMLKESVGDINEETFVVEAQKILSEIDFGKFRQLGSAGLFDMHDLPVLKKALVKPSGKLNMKERGLLVNLLDTLINQVTSSSLFSKVRSVVDKYGPSVMDAARRFAEDKENLEEAKTQKEPKSPSKYNGQTVKAKDGTELEIGKWYNFGGNISMMYYTPNSYRMKNDDTGEIVKPSGQASADTLMMALYNKKTPRSYANYCFGADYKE